jgi:hypothetical protein
VLPRSGRGGVGQAGLEERLKLHECLQHLQLLAQVLPATRAQLHRLRQEVGGQQRVRTQ